MAIWQESIIVVPNEAIKLKKPLTTDNKEGYKILWKNRNTKSEDVIAEIDSFINKADWVNSEQSIYWKGNEKKFEDNDISLTFDKETKIISFLAFRFDMRAKSLDFMNRMIKVSKENDWLFQTYNNEIFEPNLKKIAQLVAYSDLKKMIENSDKFAKELKKQKKEITLLQRIMNCFKLNKNKK